MKEKNIKVLWVQHSLKKGGGIEEVTLNIHRTLSQSNIDIDFLLLGREDNGENEEQLKLNGSQIFKIKDSIKGNNKISYYYELYKFFKKKNYKIVHINLSSGVDSLTSLVAKFAKVPKIVVHAHGSKCGNKYKFLFVRSILKRSATNFLACSDDAGTWYFGKSILNNSNYKMLPNFFETSKFTFNKNVRDEYRKYYKLNDKFVIGMVGRLAVVKNHKFSMEVLKRVLKERKNVVLLIAGDGKAKNNLMSYAKELGVDENIIFTGLVDKPENIYNMIDVFLFPSISEGLGLALVEAQYSGLKCLSSDRVPYITKITSNVEYLPIDVKDSIDKWANLILEINGDYNREKVVKDSIFDNDNYKEFMSHYYNSIYSSIGRK